MNERWNSNRKKKIINLFIIASTKAEKNCEVESIKISYSFALFTSTIYLCMKNYEHIVLVTVRVSISNIQRLTELELIIFTIRKKAFELEKYTKKSKSQSKSAVHVILLGTHNYRTYTPYTVYS